MSSDIVNRYVELLAIDTTRTRYSVATPQSCYVREEEQTYVFDEVEKTWKPFAKWMLDTAERIRWSKK